MSRSSKVTAAFGDGKHEFVLDIEGAEELQEKTGLGPEELYHRLSAGVWPTVACIREPIRIGLVRAGMPAIPAMILVDRYAGPGAILDAKPLAMTIIMALLIGAEDEDKSPSGEAVGETETTTSVSPTADGASDGSTKSAE